VGFNIDASQHLKISTYLTRQKELLIASFRGHPYILRYGELRQYGDARITFDLGDLTSRAMRTATAVNADVSAEYYAARNAIGCTGPFSMWERLLSNRAAGHKLTYEVSSSAKCEKIEVLEDGRSIYVGYERTDIQAPRFGSSLDAPG
jgi:hypothetical protein